MILDERLTQAQKDKDGKKYYKDKLRELGSRYLPMSLGYEGDEYRAAKKTNYDLLNNIIDMSDYQHVTHPHGLDMEMPAVMTNRDILSSKIKAISGMEIKRPFKWQVAAVNEDATTRREQEEFGQYKQWVSERIMSPIRAEVQARAAEEAAGRPLSEQEKQALMQRVEKDIQARTPAEIKKYMAREHQDPAELMGQHILNYLKEKERLKDKFTEGVTYAAASAEEIYFVGEALGEPTVRSVNPRYGEFDRSTDTGFIEDGDWFIAEYFMTPSQIVAEYGDELKSKEIDSIYAMYTGGPNEESVWADEHYDGVRVLHGTWKSLTKIGILSYNGPNGREEKIVSHDYKLNKTYGDIDIVWRWIPEVHECTRIGDDIYTRMRPLPSQFRDLDNLLVCKLPYIGATYDHVNSRPTSFVDRGKPYQYLYNIVFYRLEQLMAQDKGKKLFMNLNAIPSSAGINLAKWEHYLDASAIGYLNPNEEGMRKGGGGTNADVTNLVKSIDMSLISDINKYISIAEYIEKRCGEAMGVTKTIEGIISEREGVGNVQTAISMSSNVLEPFFSRHDQVKRNVLQALIECAKVVYATNNPRKLSYFMDDMTQQMVSIDQDLLELTTYGIFVVSSSKMQETQAAMTQLAHAALQNDRIDLSQIARVLRSESSAEVEDILRAAEVERREREAEMAQLENERVMAIEEKKAQEAQLAHEREMEKIVKEEELKTTRELKKQAILALGFSKDQDANSNGVPDVIEYQKILQKEAELDQRKVEADIQVSENQKDRDLKRELEKKKSE